LEGKEEHIAGVKIRNKKTGGMEEIPAAGAFVFIGQEPNTSFLDNARLSPDKWGYILTGYRGPADPCLFGICRMKIRSLRGDVPPGGSRGKI